MTSTVVHVLELGARDVKLVSFERGRTPRLLSCVAQPLEGGPEGAPPDERQVSGVVSRVLQEARLAAGSRIYLLPGSHATFSRLVTLPRLAEDKLQQLIRFEVSEQIPESGEGVAWGYAVYPGRARDESDVLLAAVKRSHLAGALQAVASSGLAPAAVLCPPLALEALARRFGLGRQPDLLIEIGTSHTTLLFVDGARLWCRTIGMGVDDLTRALAERLSRPERETAAVARRLVLWPVPEDPQDASRAEEVKQAASSFLNSFAKEISHTEQFYISSAGGRSMAHVFLTGEGSILRGLAPVLESELARPTSALDLRRVAGTAPAAVDAFNAGAGRFAAALGAVLSLAGRFEATHALRSTEEFEQLLLEAKRRDVITLLASALVILVIFFLSVSQSLSAKLTARQQLERKRASYRENQKALAGLFGELRPYQAEARAVSQVIQEKTRWPAALRELARLTGEPMWFNAISYSAANGTLTLSGETLLSLVAINDYLALLERSGVFANARVSSAGIQVSGGGETASTAPVSGLKTTRVFTCEMTFEEPPGRAAGAEDSP